MPRPDGGYAFARDETVSFVDGKELLEQRGMTLRDYFAGQMLMGIYAADAQCRIVEEMTKESRLQEMNLSESAIGGIAQARIASMCYHQADHMIAERDK